MPFRLDRSRDGGEDPWILVKVRLFSAGAALALGGMLLDRSWLIWAAMGVLGVGVVLRFVPHPGRRGAEEGEEEEDRGRSEGSPDDAEA